MEFLRGMANPPVELPYSHLMAWFMLHCPVLMQCPKEVVPPFVQRKEELNWSHDYLYNIRKIMMNPLAYEVFSCLSSILDAPLGDEYEDVSTVEVEWITALSPHLFLGLINIQPGYMVLSLDRGVVIEP